MPVQFKRRLPFVQISKSTNEIFQFLSFDLLLSSIDVEQGGHTVFPRAGGTPPPRDMNDCTRGLKVKPEIGKVIIFYNLQANGMGDDYSMHGACPVIEGVKWAANKWVWNAPMFYLR